MRKYVWKSILYTFKIYFKIVQFWGTVLLSTFPLFMFWVFCWSAQDIACVNHTLQSTHRHAFQCLDLCLSAQLSVCLPLYQPLPQYVWLSFLLFASTWLYTSVTLFSLRPTVLTFHISIKVTWESRAQGEYPIFLFYWSIDQSGNLPLESSYSKRNSGTAEMFSLSYIWTSELRTTREVFLFVCLSVCLSVCHIISYHIISYHTIPYHIIIISYHTISYYISYHIITFISYHIISYRIVSYRIIPYHTISYHISYHIIPYHTISCGMIW